MKAEDAKYLADINFEGLIDVLVIRSTVDKGIIKEIKIPELPEGYNIFSVNDIPGSHYLFFDEFKSEVEKNLVFEKSNRVEWPWFAIKRVSFKGQPIMLLCGKEKRVLEDIAKSVKISFKEENPIFDPKEAAKRKDYILERRNYNRGKFKEIYKKAFQIVEEEYMSPEQAVFNDEPLSAVADWNGKILTIYSSTLDPFLLRKNVSMLLSIPENRIRVTVPSSGAMTGGKLSDTILVAGYAALVSFLKGKPARVSYSRKEDFFFTSRRYRLLSRYVTVLDSNGDLQGMSIKLILDAGAFYGMNYDITERVVHYSGGAYTCENIEIELTVVRTNKIPASFMKGFIAPQSFLGIEVHTSRLAEIAQLDPYIWKRRNLVKKGFSLPLGYQIPNYDIPFKVLERVSEISDFQRKYAAYEVLKKRRKDIESRELPLKGIGLSMVFIGMGLNKNYESKRKSSLSLRLDRERRITLSTSYMDFTGTLAMNTKRLIREELNLEAEKVSVNGIDTSNIPDTGPSLQIRQNDVVLKLIKKTIKSVKKKRMKEILPLVSKSNFKIAKNDKGKSIPYLDLAWLGTVVEAEIDPVTFDIALKGIWIVSNLNLTDVSWFCEAPINLGIEMAIGEKLNGKRDIDELSSLLSVYRRRKSLICSNIHIEHVEKERDELSGIQDIAISGIPSSLIAAISQATGLYINELPITSSYIKTLLDKIERSGKGG